MDKKSEIVIEPKGTEPMFGGLLRYKELVYFFTWREFKIRYKETYLGVVWIVLQPLIFMAIVDFVIVQRLGARFGDGAPDAILIFLGFTLWQFFEPCFGNTISSFLSNQSLFKKLYFPKVLPAVANIISRLIDFMIGFFVLFLLSFPMGSPMPLITALLMIPGLFLLIISGYGYGLLLGSLNIRYRDIKQLVPFIVRLMFIATPVIWPLSIVPSNWLWFFYLNPAAAIIDTMRQSWYDPAGIRWNLLGLTVIVSVVGLALGTFFYKRYERSMVDIA